MLAYELYLKSKDSGPVNVPRPLKKVFVSARGNDLKIELDKETLEAYGGSTLPDTKLFQECLSMPLSNQSEIGLPSRMTGTASKRPYISLYGSYENGKVTISIKGKKPSAKTPEKLAFTYRASINGGDETEDRNADSPSIALRLDREHYCLDSKTLHQAYLEDKIIGDDDAFSSKIFFEICSRFVDFCRQRKLSTHLEGLKRRFGFELVILPYSMSRSNTAIQYQESKDLDSPEPAFVDAFDTKVTGFSSKTTQTAKFLSFDDRAFTINCTKGKDFYQNLGIGRETLQNINLNMGACFRISGLLWYFIDLTDPHFMFQATNSGIYDQLTSNYRSLSKKAGDAPEMKSVMKAVCLRKTQAKLEVLLDENLTMDQLEEALHINRYEWANDGAPHETIGGLDKQRSSTELRRHPMALETLIVNRGGRASSPLWHDYLSAVQHLITATPMDRNMLINQFSKILKENLLSWVHDLIRGVDSTDHFFEKSMFCIRLLTRELEGMTEMNSNEEYAFRIGKIAGRYVQFKQEIGEASHSTADILTYTKYDRDRLRHVYSKVCTGTCLGMSTSETPSDSEQEMTQFLKKNTPSKEIDDDKVHEDYSYFFYRGVFDSSKSEVNEK
jgi:hypothetical protein